MKSLKFSLKMGVQTFSTAFSIANIIVICRFWKWLETAAPKTDITPLSISDVLSIQSFQNSLLQTFLAIFALLVGILGIWGYQQISKQAIANAEQKVDEYLKKRKEDEIKEEQEQSLLYRILNDPQMEKNEND